MFVSGGLKSICQYVSGLQEQTAALARVTCGEQMTFIYAIIFFSTTKPTQPFPRFASMHGSRVTQSSCARQKENNTNPGSRELLYGSFSTKATFHNTPQTDDNVHFFNIPNRSSVSRIFHRILTNQNKASMM